MSLARCMREVSSPEFVEWMVHLQLTAEEQQQAAQRR